MRDIQFPSTEENDDGGYTVQILPLESKQLEN